MRFQDLKIDEAILKAIREVGYDTPTPIQEKAIPVVLSGRDLLGCAQTGTGKTAAFAIPMLQRMGRPQPGEARPVRGLILTPTCASTAAIPAGWPQSFSAAYPRTRRSRPCRTARISWSRPRAVCGI